MSAANFVRKNVAMIVLGTLAVVLGVYAFTDRDKVSDSERNARKENLFPAWRRDQLTKIELEQDGTTIRLERDPDKTTFRMTSPREEGTELVAVDRLLSVLEHAHSVRNVSDSAAAGFDAPRMRGSLTMGGLVHKFVLGKTSPTPEGSSYFRLEGQKAVVVSKEVTGELLRKVDEFRSKSLVPYLSVSLSGLEIESAKGKLRIERADSVSFRLPDLGNVRVSRETLDEVWGAIAELRAESFLPDETVDAIAAEAEVRITMIPENKGSGRGELFLGKSCANPEQVRFAVRAPKRGAGCVPRGALRGLVRDAASLVDDRPFVARADEIFEMAIEERASKDTSARTKLEIARKGTGFHMRSPEDRDLTAAETDAASGWLAAILKAEGARYSKVAGPVGDPVARVTVRTERGEEEALAYAGGFVKRPNDDKVLAMAPSLWHRFVERSIVTKPLEVMADVRDARPVLGLATRCGGTDAELVANEGGVFAFRKPTGLVADADLVRGAGEAILRARAASWVSAEDDPSFGIDESCSMTVRFAGPKSTLERTLLFGREAEGGRLARVKGESAVFVAEDAVVRLASDVFVTRALVRSNPGKFSKMSLQTPSTKTEIAAGDETEEARVALEYLVADGVVRVGAPRPEDGLSRPVLVARATFDGEAGVAPAIEATFGAPMGRDRVVTFSTSPGVVYRVNERKLVALFRLAGMKLEEARDGG